MTQYTPAYMADRMEIEDLLIRYCTAMDRHDYDLMDTVFVSDAHWDSTSVGGSSGPYKEMREIYVEQLAPFSMTHALSNIAVEIDGDTATANSYVIAPLSTTTSDGAQSSFTVCAWYHDKLERTPDGWRIQERIEEGRWFGGDLPQDVIDVTAG